MICKLCPRMCGTERDGSTSCHSGDELRIARAALHFWEEPPISGKNGSGAVFFTGCPLGCRYCQNYNISRGETPVRAVTPEEFRKRIEDNTVEEVLNRVEVHPGDVFFIEAGTLHAIGAGILICEIQQNSNCTYRVYDYGRLGADGKPRELHIEKALAVSRLTPSEDTAAVPEEKPISGGSVARLGKCKYFTTDRFTVDDEIELTVDGGSFMSLTAVEGCGQVIGPENAVDFAPGDTLFIPAGTGTVAVNGRCALVAVGVEGEKR